MEETWAMCISNTSQLKNFAYTINLNLTLVSSPEYQVSNKHFYTPVLPLVNPVREMWLNYGVTPETHKPDDYLLMNFRSLHSLQVPGEAPGELQHSQQGWEENISW